MPFFLQPEAGSGVSELLDERLRKLKLELKESEKACQALLPSVEAFTKGTREMCHGAGSAAKAFGAAIQLDSARKEGAGFPQHPAAAHDYLDDATRDVGDYGSRREEGNGTESGGGQMLAQGSRGAPGNDGSSGESMRAELMALQLIECAHEMEDHLKAQVVEPIEHVLARRSNIDDAIRERSRVADLLAAAHSDYARSVARYQSSSGDNVNGGPPLEVLRSGDRVVGASDAFAEAHGRAEEALGGLLEERGQCIRKAASSLKAAQAGFFVRASRCVSSSVGRESIDSVSSRTAVDHKMVVASKTEHPEALSDAQERSVVDDPAAAALRYDSHTTRSPAKDDKGSPAGRGELKPEAAALEIESGDGGGKVGRWSGQASSAALSMAIEDRNKVKGKWRKGSDREALRSDTTKRRRSSGWFKRLTSSFQTSRPRSASEEFRDRMPSPLHELAGCDAGGDDRKSWFRSTAPATMSSLQSSTDRYLFREDHPNVGVSLRIGRDAEPRVAGIAKSPGVVAGEYAVGSLAQVVGEGEVVAARVGGDGSVGIQAAAEEEESDYETGSNTTEGFGSDDAGDLWEGRRSTFMGPLGSSSPMLNNGGHSGEAESNGGMNASRPTLAHEKGDGGETIGDGVGHEEVVAPPALIGEAEVTGVTSALSALDVGETVVVLPAVGTETFPGEGGDDGAHEECDSDGGDPTDEVDAYDVRVRSSVDVGVRAGHGESAKDEGFIAPAPAARSTYFSTVSPSLAPPSLLPASRDGEKDLGEKEDEDHLPPVVVEQHVPESFSKLDSSPAISDASSSKESPRAWRLSWWARASDRHPPPPPNGNEDKEEAGGGTDKSVAAALTAATGGQQAAAAAMSAGGAFAPSCNTGDRPAVVDNGVKTAPSPKTMAPPERVTGSSATSAGMAAGVAAADRRSKRRSMRRRREKSWLSKDKLTEAQLRPLEAASEYLDVVALARAGMVCRSWRQPLSGDEGRRRWMRCVRLADGVPEKWRAKFYLHVLYDQPSWVGKAHGSLSSEHPRAGVYQDCLEKADADQEETEAAKKMRSTLEEEERDGRTRPQLEARDGALQDSVAPQELGTGRGEDMLPATPKFHKWLDEIETDVLRTCPDDDTGTSVDDAVTEFDSAISPQVSARAMPGTHEVGDRAIDNPVASGTSLVRFRETSFGSNHDAVDSVDNSKTALIQDTESDAPGESARSMEEEKEAIRGPSALVVGPGGAAGVPAGSDGVEARDKKRFSVAGGGTRDKLRRVLRAFAVYNRRVSYCQGMNFVALALLEACGGDDENAFWILAGMCENLELEGLWCQGLERLDLCFFSLARLLRRHCPSLRQHLADEGVELSMFTSRWFVTLFTSTDVFGRGTSRKILDMFLVEGWPLLFKMSLGVLLEMRPLLEPADMEGILKVTKFPRAHLFGLRRDGSGRNIAGASFQEATQGSLCESIRAGQMVEHALLLHISEETLEQHLQEYRLQKHVEPGSD